MESESIFRKKDFDQLKQEAGSGVFPRKLGVIQLIIIGLGAVIGGGVFVCTGKAAFLHAGPAVIFSFVLSGFICICAGLCYAEFASLIPVAGSSYTYVYATLGEFPAWLMGCSIICAYFLASSSVGSGLSGYFSSILADYGVIIPAKYMFCSGMIVENEFGAQATMDLPAFTISLVAMIALYTSTSSFAWLNTLVVVVKMLVLVVFITLGLTKVDFSNWQPFIPENEGFGKYGISGIVSGVSVIFLGFIGFESVCTAAQETKNPQRNIPIGIIGSITVSTITYILVATVLTGVVNYKLLNTAHPLLLATTAINMPILSPLIKFGAIAAIISVILIHQFTIVRLIYAMSMDGLLPSVFRKTHKKFRTPHYTTAIVGIAMGVVSSTANIEQILRLSSFFVLLGIIVVCGSILYLRVKEPKKERLFKCPFVPVVPLFGILCSLVILFSCPLVVLQNGIICLLFATMVYFVYSRHRSKLA